MALRPRLSTGLPLSNEQMIRFQEKSLANCQAREIYFNKFHLRQPGGPGHAGRDCRSMALRPRFSTGLLLSDLIDHIIASCITFTLFILVILTYKFATSGSHPLRLLQDLLKNAFETQGLWHGYDK